MLFAVIHQPGELSRGKDQRAETAPSSSIICPKPVTTGSLVETELHTSTFKSGREYDPHLTPSLGRCFHRTSLDVPQQSVT